MARTSNFANVATVTRASTKTDAGGWDFTSGGTVGTLTEYASGVAAIHPTAGLLVEESTTNELRNPRCEGAVAGTPGTAPQYWAISAAGSTSQIVGSGTDDGSNYVDLRFSGTPTGDPNIYLEASQVVAALTGEDWTIAAGIKIVGGDLTNISALRFNLIELNSSGGAVTSTNGANFTPDTDHKRWASTITLSGGASTAYVRPRLIVDWDGSGAIDVTLRVYTLQLEQKSHPTSPVLPVVSSPAAATRAADDITIASGAWLASGQGTLYAEFTAPATNDSAVNASTIVSLLEDTSSGYVLGFDARSSQRRVEARARSDAGTVATFDAANTFDAGGDVKVAVSWASTSLSVSATGATQDSTLTITGTPELATLYLGNYAVSGSGVTSVYLNGYIQDVRYWPKRLTDAELEALVGN